MIGSLAAIQLGLGAAKAIGNIFKPKKKARVSGATSSLVQSTQQQANITQGAGTAQAQSQARQTQADTLGQAALQTDDPNKLAAIASATNIQGLKAAQQRDAVTEHQRLQGQLAHTQALSQLAREQIRVQDENRADREEDQAVASNLIGAGVENFANIEKDNRMLGAYGAINDVDMSQFIGQNKIFGSGSGWLKKLFEK